MSIQQLSNEALALPIAERASLAQALWASLDKDLVAPNDDEIMTEALRRDAELTSGSVTGRTHVEVMAAARRAIA